MIKYIAQSAAPKLSILICHLPERENYLKLLLGRLQPQTIEVPVEIITASHPRGEVSIGCKRNILVNESKGEYVCFVDDDDLVSGNYVPNILRSIKTKPDCVGITGKYLVKEKPEWSFRHSITVENWCKDKSRRIYFRSPNHLNPIKRELVVKCPFPDIQFGEDRNFSDQIKPLLKTEVFVETPIYYYIYVAGK
jgi:glycosyltransferase involved in cell wall biosynthesis